MKEMCVFMFEFYVFSCALSVIFCADVLSYEFIV